MAYLVLDTSNVEDVDGIQEVLTNRIIPMLKQEPGFLRGSWSIDRATGHGVGVRLFDTEANARDAVERRQSRTPPPGVTMGTPTIYEVLGGA